MKNDQDYNIRFIKLVQQYPQLYNYTLSCYSNKQDLDKVWREISGILKEPIADCKAKWISLRNKYNEYLKEEFNNAPLAKRKYSYLAKHMQFLGPYVDYINKPCAAVEVRKASRPDGKSSIGDSLSLDLSATTCKTETSRKSAPMNRNTGKGDWDTDRNADMAFFKSLLPLIDKLDDSGKIRFRIGVMQVIQDIQKIQTTINRMKELTNERTN